jgi:hypothetical protein
MLALDLDALLKSAAEADWTQVVHRCAWCGRIADRHGRYHMATVLDASVVCTDGMCPACGARGLAAVRRRLSIAQRPSGAALAA